MGNIWHKTPTGWKRSSPLVRQQAGYARARRAFIRTESGWQEFWARDDIPPAPPVIGPATYDQLTGKVLIEVTAPGDADTTMVRVKIGQLTSVNNTTDANYISHQDGLDEFWSDWNIEPDQTREKLYPPDAKVVMGRTYTVTAWAQDASKNWSEPAVSAVTVAGSSGPDDPDPVGSTVISSTATATWSSDFARWESGTSAQTGLSDLHGVFFYSGRIWSSLSGVSAITSAKIGLQRFNTGHGADVAKVRLFAHSLNSNNGQLLTDRIHARDSAVYEFTRGQQRYIDIPPDWYEPLRQGYYTGIGIFSQTSSETSENHGVFYGTPTPSGWLYVEYER